MAQLLGQTHRPQRLGQLSREPVLGPVLGHRPRRERAPHPLARARQRRGQRTDRRVDLVPGRVPGAEALSAARPSPGHEQVARVGQPDLDDGAGRCRAVVVVGHQDGTFSSLTTHR